MFHVPAGKMAHNSHIKVNLTRFTCELIFRFEARVAKHSELPSAHTGIVKVCVGGGGRITACTGACRASSVYDCAVSISFGTLLTW